MNTSRREGRLREIQVRLFVLIVLVISLTGCSPYPPVKSREGRQLIKRLYVACNAKNEKKLADVEKDLTQLTKNGTVTSVEKQAFDSIIAMARDGQWVAAEKASLKLADGQIGHELPAERAP